MKVAAAVSSIPADTLKATVEANPTSVQAAPDVIITGHETKGGVVDSTVVRTAIDHYLQTHPKDDTYHNAKYFFASLFVNVGSSCTLGAEFIHGSRRNMDGQTGHANRIQTMIQYNF
ncbi:MAG: hypothetical protein LBU95_04565 [Rikenellaceae bacterium]|nr:hypothetical protein [Rikenellaceae bacterium]